MILIHRDNLDALRELVLTHAERVTVAYLDPPFLTNRVHRMPDGAVAFDDRWSDRSAWLEALAARLVLIRTLLAPHGCVVIHVDPKTSHLVKMFCDACFGERSFASEIVWRYRRWPSKTRNFQRVHDVLLRYRKDPEVAPRWNQLYEPLSASTLATWGTKKQRAVVDDTGRRRCSSKTDEESRGVPLGDVWDIGVIAPVSSERTGYPTQKPLELLRRLLGALTAPGDLVLDPYLGSGTTLVVASELGCDGIGIDSSEAAIESARARLEALCVEVTLLARSA